MEPLGIMPLLLLKKISGESDSKNNPPPQPNSLVLVKNTK